MSIVLLYEYEYYDTLSGLFFVRYKLGVLQIFATVATTGPCELCFFKQIKFFFKLGFDFHFIYILPLRKINLF